MTIHHAREDIDNSVSRSQRHEVHASPIAELDLALHVALLAPSPRNTQPWIFTCSEPAVVELRRDLNRSRPVCDPTHRELTISCGVALHFLQLALASLGAESKTELFPKPNQPDLVATVTVTSTHGKPDEIARELVSVILNRHTNWGEFFNSPAPDEDLIQVIASTPSGIGVSVKPVPRDKRGQVDALTAKADGRQLANPAFVAELTRWPTGRPRPKVAAKKSALGKPASPQSRDAGTLVALSTVADTARDWVAAGQALAEMLLVATGLGLSATFMNQAVQVDDQRTELGRTLDLDGVPQQLLRFGYAKTVAHQTTRYRRLVHGSPQPSSPAVDGNPFNLR